jgi:group I intron endonuclease
MEITVLTGRIDLPYKTIHYLYRITNIINGKCYIGQTKSTERRFNEHKNGFGSSLLTKAIHKYGILNFEFENLGCIREEFIDLFEQEAIIHFNSIAPNGYNLDSGGCKNKRHCEDTKRKLSEARKKRITTEETKRKMSIARIGKKLTKEICSNISKAKKGKSNGLIGHKRSEETKKKISDATKGRVMSEKTKKALYLANKGIPRSEETKKKLSVISTGRLHTKEAKEKMVISALAREEQKRLNKGVKKSI